MGERQLSHPCFFVGQHAYDLLVVVVPNRCVGTGMVLATATAATTTPELQSSEGNALIGQTYAYNHWFSKKKRKSQSVCFRSMRITIGFPPKTKKNKTFDRSGQIINQTINDHDGFVKSFGFFVFLGKTNGYTHTSVIYTLGFLDFLGKPMVIRSLLSFIRCLFSGQLGRLASE